jgi:hypothetical protein
MMKELLRQSPLLGLYSVALGMFVVSFAGIVARTWRASKGDVARLASLPLEPEASTLDGDAQDQPRAEDAHAQDAPDGDAP